MQAALSGLPPMPDQQRFPDLLALTSTSDLGIQSFAKCLHSFAESLQPVLRTLEKNERDIELTAETRITANLGNG